MGSVGFTPVYVRKSQGGDVVTLVVASTWLDPDGATKRVAVDVSSTSTSRGFKPAKVHSCFTFAANPDFLKNNIRVKPDLDALGDAGWYCLRAILWPTDFELPKSVVALHGPLLNEAGVILSCGASLYWEDGKVATFYCSFLANFTTDVTVVGTKGKLHLNDFVVPFEENKGSFCAGTESGTTELVIAGVPEPSEHTVMTDLPQEALMVKEFSMLVGSIKNNGLKPEKKWPTLSRKTRLVLDAVKASIERDLVAVEVVS
ncbi:unnamed protein product [Ilex paraguariensis]|uniref:GFO/IDH/MocA-like oxidoreductase domain-containing protein n=1 Tax=Ilex paraguariensis TaxID=185542 RepID=A0ABC8TXP4_9AQUA